MALTKILFLGCLFGLSIFRFSIPQEQLHHLSQLKFDGEDETTSNKNIFDFLKFCESLEIDDEEFSCALLSLTLEGRAKQWCYTLPVVSIHSFEQLVGKLQQEFDMYDFQDVLKRINELRMKPEESLEGFAFIFVHICFEFAERDIVGFNLV